MTVTEVGAYEARTRFAALLEQVERGDEVVITKHGRPVARLVPEAKGVVRVEEVIERILRTRETRPPATREEIREWIEEGRRW